MKKYLVEIIITIIQLILFIFQPLISNDGFAIIFMMGLYTYILSVILGIFSKNKIKYYYPIVVAIIFIPVVFILLNSSALIYCFIYAIISVFGLLFGALIKKLLNK